MNEAVQGYDYFRATIEGMCPLLMHNGALADPTNHYAREMKKITGKRKKVDADYERLIELEFKGGLYLRKGEIFIPAEVFESNLANGAKVTKEGKTALAGTFVEQDTEFVFSGPKDPEERLKDPECYLTIGVRVNNKRVMRTRPLFAVGWKASFTISALIGTVEKDQLELWLTNAGKVKGIGDWVPRYGRFKLVSLEDLN